MLYLALSLLLLLKQNISSLKCVVIFMCDFSILGYS